MWGAQAWVHGDNPYEAVARIRTWSGGLLYPFPAVLLFVPLSYLPSLLMNVLWATFSAGLLAWVVAARGVSPRVVMLLSPPLILATHASQWTPLLTAAVLLQWGGPLLVCKPTTGLWLLAYRPRLVHIYGCAAFLIASFIIWPGWVFAWRAHLSEARWTIWPLALPGAPVILLALRYWRSDGARLLLAMVCVPHTTMIYESLPLFLIPRTWFEAGVLWIGAFVVAVVHSHLAPYPNATELTRMSGKLIVWFVYLPALVMVLRHGRGDARARVSAQPAFVDQTG